MRGAGGTYLAALAAALAFFLAGCTPGSSRLDGTPAIPRRDPFRYRALEAQTKARTAQQAPRRADPPRRAVEVPPPAEPGWMPTVPERPWQWIVIHHSATAYGSAAIFDDWHRNGRHWDELGYHFVIGNGTNSGDGAVEIGPRWVKQKYGAHTKVWNREEYNQVGIGICLVGNFDKSAPTPAQRDALVRLADWLATRYRIGEDHIIGHGDVADTHCPGRYFPRAEFFQQLQAKRAARQR
ncbi:MAG: peptidoglycan recognition family protein [Phycisphaerae bacterium]